MWQRGKHLTRLNPKSFYLIAHNIRSLYNVGSFFRTADAFGVEKIYLTGYTGTPKNPKLAKTALGAEKSVTWEYHKRLKLVIQKLRRDGVKIIALENNVPLPPLLKLRRAGIPALSPLSRGEGVTALQQFKPKFPLALLLGEEVAGIKKAYLKLCDNIVEIPMWGKKESLNVAVAAGVAAYCIKNYSSPKA